MTAATTLQAIGQGAAILAGAIGWAAIIYVLAVEPVQRIREQRRERRREELAEPIKVLTPYNADDA